MAGRGDLFLAADESYLTDGQAQGLVREIVPLARMVPVIAVRKGNPCGIDSFNGLLGVTVALANPDGSSTGGARDSQDMSERSVGGGSSRSRERRMTPASVAPGGRYQEVACQYVNTVGATRRPAS